MRDSLVTLWGLPLITYAPRGGGGVNTNAYKCVQGVRGGLNMAKNMHLYAGLLKNTTISETFKGLVINYGEGGLQNGKIAGPKLFAPQDRVKLFVPPLF